MATEQTPTATAERVRPVISIDIYSDVVCPWCYIGKRRFEAGRSLAEADGDLGVDFDISYKPYQLDPTASPGVAGPVFNAYARKFGGEDKARSIIDHVTSTAADDGLDFRMDRALRANTLLAHRLIWRAGQGLSTASQDETKERLLQAYFMDGVHIGSTDALADVIAELGDERDDVVAFLESERGTAEVAAELDDAREHGITAVPTYVFNEQWAVPGAQDPATFAKVLTRMAKRALGEDQPG